MLVEQEEEGVEVEVILGEMWFGFGGGALRSGGASLNPGYIYITCSSLDLVIRIWSNLGNDVG